MFAYCNNNPTNMSDPKGDFGLFTLCFVGGLLNAAADYLSQVCNNYADGKSGADAWTDVNVGQVVASGFSGAVSAVPGGGIVSTCVDIVGGAVIEEGVNSLVNNETFSFADVGKNIGANVASEVLSLGVDSKIKHSLPGKAPSLDMPYKFSDIKGEARMWFGKKGTNSLKRYLNCKQIAVLGYNSALTGTTNMIEELVS